ncbi:MAG: fibronectin type III domain-containing protein, partial [Firmicutes bacterium]|nr:fibronectin type III domain-containing protein [Bacillota bacterium]
ATATADATPAATADPTVPSAPQSLTTSDITDSSVTLTWTPPESTGTGGDIIKYVVYYGVTASENVTKVEITDGNTLTYTADGLDAATEYTFKVCAVNASGVGASAETTAETLSAGSTATDDPDATTDPSASPTSTATADPDATTDPSASPTATATATADPDATTDPSATDDPDTEPTEPSAPMNFKASYIDNIVSLMWEAPKDDGGSDVTSYIIYWKSASDETYTNFKTVTAGTYGANIANISTGTEYTFKIAAVNSVGIGASASATVDIPAPSTSPSASAEPADESEVPSAPINFTATANKADCTMIDLVWEAPESAGSSSIGAYVVYYKLATDDKYESFIMLSVGSINTNSNGAYIYTVDKLTAGKEYDFKIAAMSGEGLGASAQTSATTLSDSDEESKDVTSITLKYGNSPYGEIMNAANIDDKDKAKSEFATSYMFTSPYLPDGCSTDNVYTSAAWDGLASNPDLDDYALFVYSGDEFDDPLYEDVGDGLTVTRSITVNVMNGTGVSAMLDSAVTQVTIADSGDSAYSNYTFDDWSGLSIRPDVYTMTYTLKDGDGNTQATKDRTVVVLWDIGDVDMTGGLDISDVTDITNIVAGVLDAVANIKTSVSNVFRYRIADIDMTGGLDISDVTEITNTVAGTVTHNNIYN